MVDDCLKSWAKAERRGQQERDRIWQEERKARQEREAQRRLEIRIRKGEVAVGGDDNTIPTFVC